MKNTYYIITQKFAALTLIILVSACALTRHSDGQQGDHSKMKASHQMPADNSSKDLNRIKALAGKWRSTTSMFGTENQEVFTQYKVTAGGSAVMETIFPGTPQEMVSLYYDDDQGNLSMTHYCMMRNRPFFKVVKSTEDEIKLDVIKVEGQKSKDHPSMGAVTLKFDNDNQFSSTCESNGKEKHDPMTMIFTRVKQ